MLILRSDSSIFSTAAGVSEDAATSRFRPMLLFSRAASLGDDVLFCTREERLTDERQPTLNAPF